MNASRRTLLKEEQDLLKPYLEAWDIIQRNHYSKSAGE
jgi:hypothetical protein